MNKKNKKIAIIGGGIAGLVCANSLSDTFNITVFEKSRGVSGRTSTRYADAFEFDHGAAYFTARTKKFQKFVQSLCDKNILTEWNPKIESLALDKPAFKKLWFEKHYVGFSRMNDMTKHLASNIADTHTIHLGTEIQSVQKISDKIMLTDKNNRIYDDFDYVVITAPAPQTFNLLPNDFLNRSLVNDVILSPAYSLMIGSYETLSKQTSIYNCDDTMIDTIIVNSDKPNRNHAITSIMVHSTPEWAFENVDADVLTMQNILLNRTLELLKLPNFKIDYITTHRWRYAKADTPMMQAFLWDKNFNIGICADWCHDDTLKTTIQGVEAAYLSASNLSHYFKTIIEHH
jgi:renalase